MTRMVRLPNGAIACLRPGAKLTDAERNAIAEFGRFLADHKAITEQYDGDERETKLAELIAAYEAEHCRRVR